MAYKQPTTTLIGLPKSADLISFAAVAIHNVSIAERKLVSLRAAAACGFEAILSDDTDSLANMLKVFKKPPKIGDDKLWVGFVSEEMQALHQCRKLFESLHGSRVTRVDTIMLALVRAGQPEKQTIAASPNKGAKE